MDGIIQDLIIPMEGAIQDLIIPMDEPMGLDGYLWDHLSLPLVFLIYQEVQKTQVLVSKNDCHDLITSKICLSP